jgi:hypothetical protein
MPGCDELVFCSTSFRFCAFAREQVSKAGSPSHHFARGRYLEALGDRFFCFLHKAFPGEHGLFKVRTLAGAAEILEFSLAQASLPFVGNRGFRARRQFALGLFIVTLQYLQRRSPSELGESSGASTKLLDVALDRCSRGICGLRSIGRSRGHSGAKFARQLSLGVWGVTRLLNDDRPGLGFGLTLFAALHDSRCGRRIPHITLSRLVA